MPQSKLGLILDCDGVLLDSMGAWDTVESALMKKIEFPLTPEVTHHVNTLTIREAGPYFHETFGIGAHGKEVSEFIFDHMIRYYRESATARPGVLDFIQALTERGVRAVVVSSSPHAFLHAGLEATGLMPYMDAVISAEDERLTKREVAIFDKARDILGTEKYHTWGFDDSRFALKTMADNGYRTVGVYSVDACATFEELQELAEIAIRSFTEISGGRFCCVAR